MLLDLRVGRGQQAHQVRHRPVLDKPDLHLSSYQTPGYEPFRRDNMRRAQRETAGYEPIETTGYEPR